MILNEELDRAISAIRALSAASTADGGGVDMLPLVQRTALRVMFRYLTVHCPFEAIALDKSSQAQPPRHPSKLARLERCSLSAPFRFCGLSHL